MLKVQIVKLWNMKSLNILSLQAFISMYLSWFSKLVIIDGNIMDDIFKELKNKDTMLIEKDD